MKFAFLKAHTGGVLGLEMITFVEPLGLEYIAGALEREGHTCLILDLRIDGTDPGMAKCREFAPQAVGIQSNFTTERYRALNLARRVKQDCPEAFVVIGGHDASREPSWYLDDAVDGIVVGDGEGVIVPLAETLDSGGDLKKVPGLMLRRGRNLESCGDAPIRTNLDELPMPARHLIKDYAPHYYFNFHKPLALLETARGCPYRCNFCSVWQFHEKTFREKSPERVVEELKTIEAPHVFITDDIFWLNVKRGKEMARLIKKAGIKKYFKIQTRTDIICRHPELVEMWKECGSLSIFLGLEKIDDEGLASVNKNNKAENNNRAIEILQQLDVGYTPNFIVDPQWEKPDFAKLRDWVDRTGAYNSGFSILTPLPGTKLWEEVKPQVTTEDWELFDIVHTVLPTKLPLDEFYKEYARLWRHALEVRYKKAGYLRTHLALGLALATGKVTFDALKKGMNLSKRFSRPATFLRAHEESEQRVQQPPRITTP
ncbi:MAG: radical SAM protein [Acidobacteriota bacterium]|nr:radical SAM protein [Acidobacteriota bacterium]